MQKMINGIGELEVRDNEILIRKYGKKFLFFGENIIVSEKKIPFYDIESVEIELIGNIGRLCFNIKGKNASSSNIINQVNTFEFDGKDIKKYEEIKDRIDKVLNNK